MTELPAGVNDFLQQAVQQMNLACNRKALKVLDDNKRALELPSGLGCLLVVGLLSSAKSLVPVRGFA